MNFTQTFRSFGLRLVLAAIGLIGIGVQQDSDAANISASSASRSAVVAALSQAQDGDVIVIPSGTSTWASGIEVDKAVFFRGQGTNSTVIRHAITSGSRRLFDFRSVSGDHGFSWIRFEGAGGSNDYKGMFGFSGTGHTIITDCHFQGLAGDVLFVYTYGVVSRCTAFLVGNSRLANLQNGSIGNGSYGDPSWETPVVWGGPNFFFIEDCIVERDNMYGAVDGWSGGRLVVRNSRFVNTRLGNHGTESSQRLRSMRAMEVYGNEFENQLYPSHYIDIRGGSALVFSNSVSGKEATYIKLNNYRMRTSFPPWGMADGTKAWDVNGQNDGAGSPGGAGNGVYEAGVLSSGGDDVAADTSKNWQDNQWRGFTLRQYFRFSASSGGIRTVRVSNAGWQRNQWAGYEFTRLSDDSKGYVISNNSDTLTLSSSYFAVDMSGGGGFELSLASEIRSNSANTIETYAEFESDPHVFRAGTSYEIRRVLAVLDGPGRGVTIDVQGSPANHQNLQQAWDPCYEWSNTMNGEDVGFSDAGYDSTIQEGRDYFQNARKPGYQPYPYPHPLLVGGDLDPVQKPVPPAGVGVTPRQ